MVVSNEPGYYKEGEFGIRCENLLMVVPSEEPSEMPMYRFQRLTLVPFDTRLLDKSLLSDSEIVDILSRQGISIARRTVAKYREMMNILPSSKRKKYILKPKN